MKAWHMARDIMAAQGMCSMCGQGPLATRYLCGRCASRQRLSAMERRKARKAAGLCYLCGDEAATAGFLSCANCRAAEKVRRCVHA